MKDYIYTHGSHVTSSNLVLNDDGEVLEGDIVDLLNPKDFPGEIGIIYKELTSYSFTSISDIDDYINELADILCGDYFRNSFYDGGSELLSSLYDLPQLTVVQADSIIDSFTFDTTYRIFRTGKPMFFNRGMIVRW